MPNCESQHYLTLQMAKRLKSILSIFLIVIVLIAFGSTQLWRVVTPQQEQVLEISDNTLEQLNALAARPKYVDEPGTIYNGMRPELRRLIAQAQLNGLIRRLSRGLPSKPSKRFVLGEFERTLALFEPIDTEDRERVCRYLEEIMDILGIESSDGVLNRWLYGSLLGTWVTYDRQSE